MYHVALSLGTNRGNRPVLLSEMEKALEIVLLSPLKKSPVYETEPVEVVDVQPWFLNRIVSGFYTGSALELLKKCQQIEIKLGRTGKGLRTSRTADIDILLYDAVQIASDDLCIPHPALLCRRFCLEGLWNIIPDCIIPSTGNSVDYHYRTMDPEIRQQKIRPITEEERP